MEITELKRCVLQLDELISSNHESEKGLQQLTHALELKVGQDSKLEYALSGLNSAYQEKTLNFEKLIKTLLSRLEDTEIQLTHARDEVEQKNQAYIQLENVNGKLENELQEKSELLRKQKQCGMQVKTQLEKTIEAQRLEIHKFKEEKVEMLSNFESIKEKEGKFIERQAVQDDLLTQREAEIESLQKANLSKDYKIQQSISRVTHSNIVQSYEEKLKIANDKMKSVDTKFKALWKQMKDQNSQLEVQIKKAKDEAALHKKEACTSKREKEKACDRANLLEKNVKNLERDMKVLRKTLDDAREQHKLMQTIAKIRKKDQNVRNIGFDALVKTIDSVTTGVEKARIDTCFKL